MSDPQHVGGAYIPAWILRHPDLGPGAKILAGRLFSLATKEGYAFASNTYLANDLDCSPRSIQHHLSSLQAAELIRVEVERGSDGTKRRIYPVLQGGGGAKNPYPGGDRSVTHSIEKEKDTAGSVLTDVRTLPDEQSSPGEEKTLTEQYAETGLPDLYYRLEEDFAQADNWRAVIAPVIRARAFTDENPPPSPDDKPWTVRRELSRAKQLIQKGWDPLRVAQLYVMGRFFIETGKMPDVEPGEPFGINRLLYESEYDPRSLYGQIESNWQRALAELDDE